MTVTVTLRQLHYFVTVAEELHFRRAAERLFMSQPALSHQIARLEGQVGVRLLERNRHRVELTAAGASFLDGAREALAQVQRSVARARWAGGQTSHGARIAYPAHCRDIVRRIVRAFSSRHPDVWLETHEMYTAAQVHALSRRALDIGFVHPPVAGKLAIEALIDEVLVVLLPANHRLARRPTVPLSALAGERILMPAGGTMSWYHKHVATRCRLAGFEPRLAWLRAGQPFDLKTVLPLVSDGVGVCLRTTSLPRRDAAGVVSLPVQERAPAVKLAIAWRREDPPPFLELFLRVAREAVSHRLLLQRA